MAQAYRAAARNEERTSARSRAVGGEGAIVEGCGSVGNVRGTSVTGGRVVQELGVARFERSRRDRDGATVDVRAAVEATGDEHKQGTLLNAHRTAHHHV
jgi:hypothetical protein